MDTKRVRRHRLPGYPTRLEVLARPDLLREHQPSAWRRNAEMAGLVTVFLAANGCVKSDGNGAAGVPEQGVAVVAPIFEHGDGRGATGCVVAAPPAFLSEEDAMQIIGEELSLAGIDTAKGKHLKGVMIPEGGMNCRKALERQRPMMVKMLERYRERGDKRREESMLKRIRELDHELKVFIETKKELHADVFNEEEQIALEYVSREDYMDLGGVGSMSTVQSYEFKDVARGVSEKVREQGKGFYFGAFYDPAADRIRRERYTDADGRQSFRWITTPDESKRLLRQQVKDFVEWLRGQGAI